MTQVRVISLKDAGEAWYKIYINHDLIAYIEQLNYGDFKGHYLLAFNSREFVLHKEDLKIIFDT